MNKQEQLIGQVRGVFKELNIPEAAITGKQVVQTKLGPMDIQYFPPEKRGRQWTEGWLHCRFDDPVRANSGGAGCNPFSGKWNFHTDDVECIRRNLSQVLQ